MQDISNDFLSKKYTTVPGFSDKNPISPGTTVNKVYLSNIQFTKIFIFGQVVARFCLWREENIQNILKNNALHKSVNIKKTSY